MIQSYTNIINSHIENNPFDENNLFSPLNYILNNGGKRMRPVLTLLACDIFGGNVQNAIKPAIAMEYFHNFTLIHDDIMDNANLRRGNKTIHHKWNTNTAILSGDALFIKAYQYFEDLEKNIFKPIIEIFSQTALDICIGQQMDIDFESKENISAKNYMEMIRLKTAILPACCLKTGAIIAGANKKQQDIIYSFGEKLGLAFQLQDDYLDVFGGEKIGKKSAGDIIENKKTLLFIKTLEKSNNREKKELLHLYDSKNFDETEKITKVKGLFEKYNSDKFIKKEILNFTEKSILEIEKLSVSKEKKQVLTDFAFSFIDRKF